MSATATLPVSPTTRQQTRNHYIYRNNFGKAATYVPPRTLNYLPPPPTTFPRDETPRPKDNFLPRDRQSQRTAKFGGSPSQCEMDLAASQPTTQSNFASRRSQTPAARRTASTLQQEFGSQPNPGRSFSVSPQRQATTRTVTAATRPTPSPRPVESPTGGYRPRHDSPAKGRSATNLSECKPKVIMNAPSNNRNETDEEEDDLPFDQQEPRRSRSASASVASPQHTGSPISLGHSSDDAPDDEKLMSEVRPPHNSDTNVALMLVPIPTTTFVPPPAAPPPVDIQDSDTAGTASSSSPPFSAVPLGAQDSFEQIRAMYSAKQQQPRYYGGVGQDQNPLDVDPDDEDSLKERNTKDYEEFGLSPGSTAATLIKPKEEVLSDDSLFDFDEPRSNSRMLSSSSLNKESRREAMEKRRELRVRRQLDRSDDEMEGDSGVEEAALRGRTQQAFQGRKQRSKGVSFDKAPAIVHVYSKESSEEDTVHSNAMYDDRNIDFEVEDALKDLFFFGGCHMKAPMRQPKALAAVSGAATRESAFGETQDNEEEGEWGQNDDEAEEEDLNAEEVEYLQHRRATVNPFIQPMVDEEGDSGEGHESRDIVVKEKGKDSKPTDDSDALSSFVGYIEGGISSMTTVLKDNVTGAKDKITVISSVMGSTASEGFACLEPRLDIDDRTNNSGRKAQPSVSRREVEPNGAAAASGNGSSIPSPSFLDSAMELILGSSSTARPQPLPSRSDMTGKSRSVSPKKRPAWIETAPRRGSARMSSKDRSSSQRSSSSSKSTSSSRKGSSSSSSPSSSPSPPRKKPQPREAQPLDPLENDLRLSKLAVCTALNAHNLAGIPFDGAAQMGAVHRVKFCVVKLALPLGLLFQENPGGCWVARVFPDGAAARGGGVREGDQLAAVDGRSAIEMSVDGISRLIEGAENPGAVELTFLRFTGKLVAAKGRKKRRKAKGGGGRESFRMASSVPSSGKEAGGGGGGNNTDQSSQTSSSSVSRDDRVIGKGRMRGRFRLFGRKKKEAR